MAANMYPHLPDPREEQDTEHRRADSAKAAEKFLYSFKVYASDIPDDDILNLTRGIIFKTKEELASFEEDYNS